MQGNGNVLVSIEQIRRAFEDLIRGIETRENLANWAFGLMEKHDSHCLVFEPSSERDRIWRSIIYLTGVDLKIDPTTYLHDVTDFVAFFEENLA